VSIDSLDDYYRQHLGLSVTLLPPIAVDPGAFDAARGQFVAERVIGSMKRSLPALAADPTVTVIGLLEDDMYIAALNWRFAFNFREGDHFAVVSSRRMVPSFHSIWKRDALLQSRIRKMITKDVGILAYGLPLSSDPTSLLYRDVQGVDDLDLVQERFDGLGQLAEISPTVLSHREKAIQPEIRPRSKNAGEADGRYPCFVVRPGAGWDGVSPIDARVTECLPGLRAERTFDEFELNLQWRYLVTRQTDLFVNDTPPLALTRCSRDFDSISRAFGIGWNHPYDILPAGSRNPYTYIDIIMPDGGLIHYNRISEGTGYADALYEHTATSTAFLHSEFQWNGDGWNLRFTDGSLFVFPENYSGTRANQGAPTEMRDGNGHLTRFQRDRGRNLERLTSPGGRFIRFEHDASSRVTMATDEAAHTVRYEYDAGGRLASVTNAGVVLRYRYVGTDLAAIDNGSRSMLRVERERGRVSRLQLADGRSFRFSFVPSSPGGIQGTTIVEAPDGTRTEVAVAEGQ
jgi:YD repeat-containing protein